MAVWRFAVYTVEMQWNELSRKTIGIIVALVVLFAGTVIVITVYLIRQRGGGDIAFIVQNAIENQRVTFGGEGVRVVSDRLIVTFRAGTELRMVKEVMRNTGVSFRSAVEGEPDTYIAAFPAATVRQLRHIIEKFEKYPDVVGAAMIPAE